MRTRRSNPNRPSTPPRSGAIVLVAMLCLVLISMIMASLLRTAVMHRRHLRSAELEMQAAWLAEAGLARSGRRLARDPDYAGEEWPVPAEALGGSSAASVRIEVAAPDEAPDRRRITVTAEYPAGATRRARVTRETTIDLPRESE